MAWTARAGLDLVFPPRCLSCRRRGSFLCAVCIQAINRLSDPFCPVCESLVDAADPHCRCRAPAPLYVIAAGTFEGPLRGAIHSFKYQGQKAGAADLADLVAPRLRDVLRPGDRIVPIPLHGRRETARGYNQSALLARALARRLGAEPPRETMMRVRDTPRQVGLDREARRRNVKDAFTADPALCRGRSIIMVDDVCTTGATLHAAALAALTAGAQRVSAVVLARA
ncbi:MAG: ComF family protein, partial [Chloroflexota bacterium]